MNDATAQAYVKTSGKTRKDHMWRWAGILPTLVALCLLLSPIGRPLVLLSFDALYLFRPAPDSKSLAEVVILDMDEESRAALHQDPDRRWDRRDHARLLKGLTLRGAKVVVFDVLFDEPSTDVSADEALATAIREHGNVVLAMSLQPSQNTGGPRTSHLLRPADSLGTNAHWGLVEWPLGVGREPIIRQQFTHPDYRTLAWEAAVAYGLAPRIGIPSRWLNFYGPEGTLHRISYHRALGTNLLTPGFFSGKAVFVGQSSRITSHGQNADLHATPFSRWHEGQTSGVEIHATAFLNLIRNETLQEISPAMEVLILLFMGWILGLGLPKSRPWIVTLKALGLAAVVAGTAIGIAWRYYYWFPWLIICAVQIPCALAWSTLASTIRLTEENENLERSLALSESLANLPGLRGQVAQSSMPHQTAPKKIPGTLQSMTFVETVRLPPIPNHRLLRCIGRGSYGEVWIAQDEIGAYHAVKIVYLRNFNNASPLEREFKGLQRFTPISRSHPGFVNILHVGRNDPEGYFFYIMELGDDKLGCQPIEPETYSPNTLASTIESGRLTLPKCVQLGLDLTAALGYLHDHQLIHRDIKPSNIVFVNGRPKFADIGLVTGISPKGKEATFVGTEGYIPPEGPGTVAADIYGLGKVLYEACTGRDRNEFPSLSSTLIADAAPQLTHFNDILLKACHPDISQRYQSASEMHFDLVQLSKKMAV